MAKKKKAPPAEKENGERWLVSYSDFVTLLLGVFIIMYSMAAADAEKAGGNGESESKFIEALASSFGNSVLSEDPGESIIDLSYGEKLAIENLAIENFKSKVEEYIEDIGLNNESISIEVDEFGVHVSITDKVLFNSGKYEINPDAIPILTSIGNFIYSEFSTNNIMVKGYTDNVPVSGNGVIQSNWELGSLRAVNVLKLLVNKASLNPTKMTAVSYGEYQPIASNRTLEGRAKNRRVEISILRNYPL